MFPENLIQATFAQYSTKLVIPSNFTNETDVYELETASEYTNAMNILGLVVFSSVLGVILSQMKEKGLPVLNFFGSLNEAILILTKLIITITPLAVIFLIIPQILQVDDLSVFFGSIGMYFATVMIGLILHIILILPLLYFVFVRKNPIRFLSNMSEAILTAFGTSSSSATMPVRN